MLGITKDGADRDCSNDVATWGLAKLRDVVCGRAATRIALATVARNMVED